MTRRETSAALRADTNIHYNCAQAVLIPFAEDLGISPEQAKALAADFGSGMGCGSICGAVTGALMALGGLGLSTEKRSELFAQFRSENGALDCASLIKAAAERGEPKKHHCDRVVAQCTDFVCKAAGLDERSTPWNP